MDRFSLSSLPEKNHLMPFSARSNRSSPYRFLPLIFLLCFSSYAAHRSVVQIPSACMNKNFNALVVTPEDYTTGDKRFSKLFLLHGYSGDCMTWSTVAPIDEYADKYRIIFVCPDGNYNSWYIDSPVRQDSKFES